MKIAIILDETWNSSLTFLGKAFLEALEESHHVSLLCLNNSFIDNNVEAKKYYIANLRTKNPISFFNSLNQIRNYFKQIKPDLVFTIRGDATFYSCLLKKHFGFKLIRVFGENRKPSLNRHCIDYVFLSSKKFESYLNIPHTVVNGVVDTNKFTFKKDSRLKIRKEFNIDISDFLYGFIGRTSKVKGIFMLLEAFANLSTNAKLFMLVYETEIKINDILQHAKQLNIENRIIIESNFRNDVEDIISAFDVGVISSIDSEAIARTALEFLSCKLPCVVTNVGCLSEVVDESCGIVCKANVSSLYQSLLEIQNKNLALLSEAAFKKAQIYSKENLKLSIIKSLNEIKEFDKKIK